jgi:solute carrier family 30 (zinc transporter), member 9
MMKVLFPSLLRLCGTLVIQRSLTDCFDQVTRQQGVLLFRTIHDVKATDVGGRHVRFKAEVDFDGREITRFYLEQQDLEKMMQVC